MSHWCRCISAHWWGSQIGSQEVWIDDLKALYLWSDHSGRDVKLNVNSLIHTEDKPSQKIQTDYNELQTCTQFICITGVDVCDVYCSWELFISVFLLRTNTNTGSCSIVRSSGNGNRFEPQKSTFSKWHHYSKSDNYLFPKGRISRSNSAAVIRLVKSSFQAADLSETSHCPMFCH